MEEITCAPRLEVLRLTRSGVSAPTEEYQNVHAVSAGLINIIWITVKHVVGCFKVLNRRGCLRQGLAPDDLILVSGSWLLISWKRSHTFAYKGIEDGIILLIMYIDIFSDNCSDNWSVWARRSEMSWSVLLEELASNHKQGIGCSRVQGQYQDSRHSCALRKTPYIVIGQLLKE